MYIAARFIVGCGKSETVLSTRTKINMKKFFRRFSARGDSAHESVAGMRQLLSHVAPRVTPIDLFLAPGCRIIATMGATTRETASFCGLRVADLRQNRDLLEDLLGTPVAWARLHGGEIEQSHSRHRRIDARRRAAAVTCSPSGGAFGGHHPIARIATLHGSWGKRRRHSLHRA